MLLSHCHFKFDIYIFINISNMENVVYKFLVAPSQYAEENTRLVKISVKLDELDRSRGFSFEYSNGETRKLLSPDAHAAYSDPDSSLNYRTVFVEDNAGFASVTSYTLGTPISYLYKKTGLSKLDFKDSIQPVIWQFATKSGANGDMAFKKNPDWDSANSKTIYPEFNGNHIGLIVAYLTFRRFEDNKLYPQLQLHKFYEFGWYKNEYGAYTNLPPTGNFGPWSGYIIDPNKGSSVCEKERYEYKQRVCNEADGNWYGTSCSGPNIKDGHYVTNNICAQPGTWSSDYPLPVKLHFGSGRGQELWGAKCIKANEDSVCPGRQPIDIRYVDNGDQYSGQCGPDSCMVNKIIIGRSVGAYLTKIGWKEDEHGIIKGFAFEFSDQTMQKVLSPYVDNADTDPYVENSLSSDENKWISEPSGIGGFTQFLQGKTLKSFYENASTTFTTKIPQISQWSVMYGIALISKFPESSIYVNSSIAPGRGEPAANYLMGYHTNIKHPVTGKYYPTLEFWEKTSDIPNLTLWGSNSMIRSYPITQVEPEKIKPLDGGWSDWELINQYIGCSTGNDIYRRSCSQPYPETGGYGCYGSDVKEEEVSNTAVCDVDAVMSEWGSWEFESGTHDCGTSYVEKKTRTCDTPATGYGQPCGRLEATRYVDNPDCLDGQPPAVTQPIATQPTATQPTATQPTAGQQTSTSAQPTATQPTAGQQTSTSAQPPDVQTQPGVADEDLLPPILAPVEPAKGLKITDIVLYSLLTIVVLLVLVSIKLYTVSSGLASSSISKLVPPKTVLKNE
jgi:hypothetical protein